MESLWKGETLLRKTAFSALGLILDTEEAGFRTVVLFIVDFITLCQQLRGIHFFHNTLIPFHFFPYGLSYECEKKKKKKKFMPCVSGVHNPWYTHGGMSCLRMSPVMCSESIRV